MNETNENNLPNKKQGLQIDDIINEVMNNTPQTNRSEISLTSITFPDKVKVQEPQVIKGESCVPFLELNSLPIIFSSKNRYIV